MLLHIHLSKRADISNTWKQGTHVTTVLNKAGMVSMQHWYQPIGICHDYWYQTQGAKKLTGMTVTTHAHIWSNLQLLLSWNSSQDLSGGASVFILVVLLLYRSLRIVECAINRQSDITQLLFSLVVVRWWRYCTNSSILHGLWQCQLSLSMAASIWYTVLCSWQVGLWVSQLVDWSSN